MTSSAVQNCDHFKFKSKMGNPSVSSLYPFSCNHELTLYVTTTELDAYLYFSAPALQAWNVFYCIIFTFCCECCLLNIWKYLANHYLYKQYTGIVLFTFVFSLFCVCMCVLQFLCIKRLLTNTVACLCYTDDLRENEHEELFFFFI